MTALQKDLIKRFEDKMMQIDSKIKKKDVISENLKIFTETEDKETIIKHIISPLEFEKDIFNNKYNSLL